MSSSLALRSLPSSVSINLLPESLGQRIESPGNGRVSATGSSFLCKSFVRDLNFTSSFITICFFATLLVNPLRQLSVFVQCHLGLSVREKEAAYLQALLSVCDPKNSHRPPVTDRSDRIVADHDASVIHVMIRELKT